MIAFDAAKHFLGNVCRNGHVYDTDNHLGLRYITNKACIECINAVRQKGISAKRDKSLLTYVQKGKGIYACPYPKPDFDSSTYFLGTICHRNHEFCSGLGLRYNLNRDCVQCRCESSAKRYKDNIDLIREQNKSWYRRTIEERKKYEKQYYLNNKDRYAEWKRKYTEENKEKIRERDKKYKQSARGKEVERKSEHKRRALEKKAHHFPWNELEIAEHFAKFDNSCAYCGNKERQLTADHFISIDSGGANCLNNIVPCCRPCNSSKRNRHPEEWYPTKSYYSKKRWHLILKVLGLTKTGCNQMPLF